MSNFYWLSIIVGFALLFAVIPAMFAQNSLSKERSNLLEAGEQAEAEILGYEKDEYLWVRYSFQPNGQNEIIHCRKIIGNLEEQFPIGKKIVVRYKKQHPHISVLEPYAGTQLSTS
jgi:hypothetical protein